MKQAWWLYRTFQNLIIIQNDRRATDGLGPVYLGILGLGVGLGPNAMGLVGPRA